jgi:hypothetical protein
LVLVDKEFMISKWLGQACIYPLSSFTSLILIAIPISLNYFIYYIYRQSHLLLVTSFYDNYDYDYDYNEPSSTISYTTILILILTQKSSTNRSVLARYKASCEKKKKKMPCISAGLCIALSEKIFRERRSKYFDSPAFVLSTRLIYVHALAAVHSQEMQYVYR